MGVAQWRGMMLKKRIREGLSEEIPQAKAKDTEERLAKAHARFLDLMALPETYYEEISNYKEFLNTEYWQIVRDFKVSTERCCQDCGTPEELRVHHLTYAYPRFQEHLNLEKLRVLCNSCHVKAHGLKSDNPNIQIIGRKGHGHYEIHWEKFEKYRMRNECTDTGHQFDMNGYCTNCCSQMEGQSDE